MNFFLYLTNFIVPFLILAIIVYGLLMKINVYEHFIKGARNGFLTVLKIMPTLIGLMVSVGILRASGFLEMISSCIGQFTAAIGFPGELVGTDSLIGLIASISMSCTETIFYTMSVYFMTAKIKNSRYTLTGALIATFAGLAASVVLAQFMLQ